MTNNFAQKTSTFTSKLEERVVFFFVAVGIISLTYGFFALIDFLPEKPEQETDVVADAVLPALSAVEQGTDVREIVAPVASVYPRAIIFDTLDEREVTILNPESSTIEALDSALLSGVVRHPDSADFENTGTIFLLGHSSYLPSVLNKNFQAFNGIQKLVWGDTIRVQSEDTEYVYRVERVYEAKAVEAEIDIVWGEPKLVLATCNSFGTKDDRFIVEALFVESYPLGT